MTKEAVRRNEVFGTCKRVWLWTLVYLLVGSNAATAQEPLAADAGYKLGPEDVLLISVWEDERMTREVLVRPDGMISFPLIGEVEAAGHTAAELQRQILKRLRTFIPDPSVLVALKQINSYKIYVIGKVNRPGVFSVGHQLDVLQALTLAGGLAPFAAENNIKVLHREKGIQRAHSFRYGDIKKGGKLKQNRMLSRGDIVVVP